MRMMRRPAAVLIVVCVICVFSACGTAGTTSAPSGNAPDGQLTEGQVGQQDPNTIPSPDAPEAPYDDSTWSIHVTDPAGEVLLSFTAADMLRFAPEQAGLISGVYSTINNWPSSRFYVAEGYSVVSILSLAGVHNTAQTVTFRSADGYEASLTREQLFSPQYYYPRVGEGGDGAEPVQPIIAYRWREGTDDLNDLRDDYPSLIIGQRNPFEQTNVVFVEEVIEILVDTAPCGQWPPAGTFPAGGTIAAGETVKLQHPSFGLVKLHYTLDGSDPTPLSPVYNPSTYRPELNVPIAISGPTTIKVLVVGYGMSDSDIATFYFEPEG